MVTKFLLATLAADKKGKENKPCFTSEYLVYSCTHLIHSQS